MPARERFVDANGLRFHLYDWGGNGMPLVLLHGLASNARIWDFVAPLLVDRARVVAVDQRSHGFTAGPDVGYGFDETAADLAAVIVGLGFEHPVVAGHSWGANVAVEFAARKPGVPAGLILVDGGIFSPRSDGLSWEDTERRLAPPRIAGTPRTTLVERIKSGDLGAIWQPEFEEIIMAGFEQFLDGTVAPRLAFDRHLQIVRALWEADTPARFAEIECPVLVLPSLSGAPEQVARKQEAVTRAAARLRHGSIVWLEDSIHDVPLQRPELVAHAIAEFLTAVSQARPPGPR
ncbi:MAG: alpha/beta fold hydrolase [Dehalococcoidia bacterium]